MGQSAQGWRAYLLEEECGSSMHEGLGSTPTTRKREGERPTNKLIDRIFNFLPSN